MQRKTVKISRAQEDTAEILKEAVKSAALHGKQRIFVKPNMSHPEYVSGVVTSPALLRELVSILRDDNDAVIVGESRLQLSLPLSVQEDRHRNCGEESRRHRNQPFRGQTGQSENPKPP